MALTIESLTALHREGKQVPRDELVRHNRDARLSAGLAHLCPACSRFFTSKSGVSRHLSEYHGNKMTFISGPNTVFSFVADCKMWIQQAIIHSESDCGKVIVTVNGQTVDESKLHNLELEPQFNLTVQLEKPADGLSLRWTAKQPK